MFKYCTEILNLSEHEAFLRIEVARASRKHPVLLEMLADGRLHLSGIGILHRHLNEANRDSLLRKATHKSKRQIEELVAELAPKPDVKATMRKLPERPSQSNGQREVLGPDLVPSANPDPTKQSQPESETKAETQSAPPPEKPAKEEPIGRGRYKVTFTASAELCDKLERLKALMRSSIPDGDLAAIIDEAVTEKLEKLEAKRYGKTKSPRKSVEETNTSPSSRYIPAPVRRAVYARDGGQCRFVDESGRRCTERHRLEFHHDRRPYGRGGRHDPSNLKLMCRTHNLLLAECDYGREHINRYRSAPDRVSEAPAVYTSSNRATRAC
jgi:hypothetical protein